MKRWMNRLKIFILAGAVFLVSIGAGVYKIWSLREVVCTQEARECPGGYWVSRQPPDCQFAPCPSELTAGWKRYVSEKFAFAISYPPGATPKIFAGNDASL